MEYKAEGARPRGRPKRTWRQERGCVKRCLERKLNREDAMVCIVQFLMYFRSEFLEIWKTIHF